VRSCMLLFRTQSLELLHGHDVSNKYDIDQRAIFDHVPPKPQAILFIAIPRSPIRILIVLLPQITCSFSDAALGKYLLQNDNVQAAQSLLPVPLQDTTPTYRAAIADVTHDGQILS